MSCYPIQNFSSMKRIVCLLFPVILCSIGFGQTLPFQEDFESVGSTTTFTASTTSINGLGEWSYEKTNRGRLRFKAGTGFSNGGSAAATMDVFSNNQYSTNYLILTLDLSAYTTSDLELSFSYMDVNDESNSEDRVWIRGDNTENWVQIYDWYANRATGGTWTDVNGLDIDAVLAAASPSQTVGKTFQVRFGQRDNYPAQSTTRDDGVSFDDIEIVERFDREGIMSNLSDICPGSNTVSARLYNNGLDTIKSAIIDWTLNGTAQKSAVFTGAIAPGRGRTITLGTATFLSTTNAVAVVCDSINGNLDQHKDDTLKVSRAPGLKGSYTIGGSNPDYNTVIAAISDLNTLGICGEVDFSIADGTYSGALSIGAISGSSASNTITFKGQDSSKTIITHSGNAFEPTLVMSGSQYIYFENIKLQNTRTRDAWVVRMFNSCADISFSNCWFAMSSTGNDDLIGLVASNSGTDEHAQGDNVNRLKVDACNFTGGERGIDVIGSTTQYSTGNSVTNCTFNNQFYTASYFNYQSTLKYTGNTADNFRSNGADALLIYNVNNFQIEKNAFYSEDYAAYLFNVNTGGSSRGKFYNNMFAGGGHGVYFNGARNIDVFHNTILGDPGLRFNNETGISVKNNIMYGASGVAFYASGTGFDEIDWNVYYSTETNKYVYDNNSYTSLGNWTSAETQLNQNSVQKQPSIVSTTNLYLSKTKAADRAPSLGIAKDIDSDLRCDIAVSIGADESKYADTKPTASFNLPDTAYVNAIVTGTNNRAGVLKTFSWYVDGVLSDSGSTNLNHKFTSLGRHKVTHYSHNCGGTDSVSKFVVIVPVTAAVIPGFQISKKVIDIGESTELKSTSQNGPSNLYWSISPYWIDKKSRTYNFTSGFDSVSTITNVVFNKAGEYTVCLYAANSLGGTTLCKQNVISVRENAQICGTITTSDALYGTILDPGGTGNYPGFQRYNCNYTITPCAKDLTLKFTSFDLVNNRDYLKIYNGIDNGAPSLHDYHTSYSNGLTGTDASSNFNSTLKANSGKVYMEFTTSSIFGAGGFEIEWSGTKLVVPKPTASFEMPDSICTGSELFMENKSSGQGNTYQWLITAPVTNDVEYTDSAVSHFFFFAGKYTVRLVANNCGGSDTMTKVIRVIDAPSAPTAKAHIDVVKPDVNQVVTLTDVSFVKGYPCSEFRTWRITPAAKVSYVSGYNTQSPQTKVTFSDTGCYTVRLIASNSQGRDTVLMNCAIRVIKRCVPTVTNLDADVGIAKVVLGTINNSSATGVSAYTDYRATAQTDLVLGQTYDMSIFRPSGPTALINRKVWIDYNLDGDFDDKGELVASDTAATRTVKHDYTFRVPLGAKIGAATMRVAVSKNLSANLACGTNVNGEFEDYLVNITEDLVAPDIYLYGHKDTTISECIVWSDPSGYALDNAQLDTIKLSATGTVDYSKAGNYTITYNAVDSNGNTATATRTVAVSKDQVLPVATLTGMDTIYQEVNTPYLDAGATYSDNCGLFDTVVTNTLNLSLLGTYYIEYAIRDLQLNQSTVRRIIIVEDNTPPMIDSLKGGDTVKQQIDSLYIEKGIVFHDNYDPIDSIELTVKGTVDVNTIGDYKLWYIVRDKQGNADSTFRIVQVNDYLTPEITLLGQLYDTLDVGDFHVDMGVTYKNFNGDTVGLTLSYGGTYVDAFGYEGQAIDIGTYTLIYTVSNKQGAKSTEMRYIVVLDRIAPKLVLKGDNPLELFVGDTYVEPGWDWTDNYWDTPEVWIYTFGVVDENVVDTYFLFYYAADSSSNVSDTLVRVVFVKDTATSIVGADDVNISVFPNPNRGTFNLDVRGIRSSALIEVFDPLGRNVYSNQLKMTGVLRTSIELEEPSPGSYILVLKTDDAVLTKNLIIR